MVTAVYKLDTAQQILCIDPPSEPINTLMTSWQHLLYMKHHIYHRFTGQKENVCFLNDVQLTGVLWGCDARDAEKAPLWG